MLIICEYTLKSNEIACKVTIFFEYIQVYSKKYSFFCTYTFFFVPSNICLPTAFPRSYVRSMR